MAISSTASHESVTKSAESSGAKDSAKERVAVVPPVSEGAAPTNFALLKWMFGFLKPVKLLVFICLVYLAGYVAAEVLFVRQTAEAVNYIKKLDVHGLSAHVNRGFLAWFFSVDPFSRGLRDVILWLALLAVAMAVLRYLREVSSTKLSMHMVFFIREAVYDKLQRVGFKFHDAIPTGQLINRALTDLQNVRAFVQSSILTTMEMVLIVGGYIILILTRSPWVALLAVVPLPIWTWYILRFTKKVRPVTESVMQSSDRDVNIITENIAGVHVVKAFATEQVEIKGYNQNTYTYFNRIVDRIRMFANFTPVVRSIASASYLSLFLAGGVLLVEGKLDVGDFLILGSAMSAILTRLQQVQVLNEQYQSAIVSAQRLHEVLSAPATIDERPAADDLPPGPGAVRFEHVTFGYDPSKPVLHDICFEVPGGGVVAIVGPTGAGKSTLVSLISRFYDPQQGRILIDGTDVRDIRLSSLRTQVSHVFQETYLFSDSVSANISYGREYQRAGEVEAASRLAQAHEFIEKLPEGYRTVLAERGSSLSGGQRQRLAIARAIMANPRVLILDDATAAIDAETEDLIRRGMKFAMQGRTTFLIAHRISTVKRADLVIVLEQGRISQIGTHRELMRRKGHYRDIALAQLYGGDSAKEPNELPSHMDRVQAHSASPERRAARKVV